MPAKKRPAAVDSAAPAAPVTPVLPVAPAPDASHGSEVSAASHTPPAPKKAAGKRGVKAAAKPAARPAPEASEPPKRAAAKAKRSAPATLADAVVPGSSQVGPAVVVASAPATQPIAAAPRPRPTDDEIRQYAYFLSLRRNGRGDPIADWMEAERALRARTD